MKDLLLALAWVALGSAMGGTMRYYVSGLVARLIGEAFPWGTLTVNVTGSMAIGIAAAASMAGVLVASPGWQFAVTGFLGCYTTVSSFSLQTLALARDGEFPRALANVAGSLCLCLGAVALGFGVGSILFGASLP